MEHETNRTYRWDFPLPRTHTGVLQGNGTMGVMIWGEGRELRLTIGRADFWDHRGGMPWRESMSYAAIRALLEAGDGEGLRDMFASTLTPGEPARPTVLPLGRVDLTLAEVLTLDHAVLDVMSGQVALHAQLGGDVVPVARLDLAMEQPVLLLEFEAPDLVASMTPVPAWEFVGDQLAAVSFRPPSVTSRPDAGGWVQERPADPPLCLAYVREGPRLWVATAYGDDPADARRQANRLIGGGMEGRTAALREANAQWWAGYWADVPRVSLPNPDLDFLYHYGMYKFAGLTAPQGVAATLQGPWIEEYQLPPWSSDYHFNINVQMCYAPAYRGNHLSHLRPLFDTLATWTPVLRENARVFLGIDDGLMLPHAVDDRGTCMGGFWTGSVDHGCTAWVADMMVQYWRYSGDDEFLREQAYPFMVSAMRVYQGMLERSPDGSLHLPISVSPEFRGSDLDAWGRDASFQLACLHRLAQNLLDACQALGVDPDPAWSDIRRNTPLAALDGEPGMEQIALWDGLVLPESHRHHSHLAGLYPFDIVPTDDPTWSAIVRRSAATWVREGMGMWSGWAMPWAAILHSRLGHPDMAEQVLGIWQRVFTNLGHGTLHDPDVPGFTLIGSRPTAPKGVNREIMQMDAGMGVTAAIMELLVSSHGGLHRVLPGAPEHWRDVSFDGILTEGGALLGATRRGGVLREAKVTGTRPGTLRLANPWPGQEAVDKAGIRYSGAEFAIPLAAGSRIRLVPVP